MNPPLMGWILLGAILMFAVGLADDFFDLNPIVKFAGQIVALGPPALAGLRFLSVERFVLPVVSPTMLSMAAALVWMLFFVNAFNFMDGMDGFATRFSLTAIFWLFVAAAAGSVVGFASSAGDSPPGVPPIDLRVECFLLAILSAACGGFYRLNRPPARVFMGDAGSLSLGYLLAAQAILADAGVYNSHPQPPEPGRAVTAPAVFIILFPFTFDVLLTLARRVRRGENLLRAHRSHLYQRLMIAGMTHAETLRVNQRYFVACGAAGCGYALAPTVELRALAAAFALAVMLRYWRFVVRKERAAARE
jgi:UDP-N-acetylmuramyl pentapeptide phosphotransferase/UDP-N-acetylglucosamine-1-phosphate transferase